MTAITHSTYLTVRSLRTLWRQPAFAAATLIQPIIWPLLFGALFKSVVEIPGYEGGSYLEFITPGRDRHDRADLERLGRHGLHRGHEARRHGPPARVAGPPGAMMVGTLAYRGVTTIVQTLTVFAIALIAGARFAGGVDGVLVTLVAAVPISVIIASLSNAIALLVRQQEALIGISQFIVLPLQFLSSALIGTSLAPAWVQHVARFNPVDRAVVASREALATSPDWSMVWPRLGLLFALATVMAWLATRAFGSYQRSL
jgi:ABC-2 type transport system permease protein